MKQMRVLIAEDEPIVVRYIKRILESCEVFEVIADCETGEEAEALCLQEKPDLLITDIRMAGISGLELIRRIKQHGLNMQMVIVSGYKDFAYAKEAIFLGVEDYITKPINPDELKTTLLRIWESYGKQIAAQKTFDMEQILREQNEEAFHNQFPYTRCRMLMVYQSGDIDELHFATVHDKCRISFFYRNSLMLLVGGEKMDKGDFSNSIDQITAAKGKGKTCTVMTVGKVDLGKDCFAVFQQMYRSLREQTIPGKLVIKRYPSSENIPPQNDYQDEVPLKRVENKIAAKEWKGLLERIQELFLFWEKEQYDLYHIKTTIHQITDQMYKAGAFEQGKLIINEYLDDCLRYAESYTKMREIICTYLEKAIKNRDHSPQEGKNADQIFEQICRYVLQNEDKYFSLNEICYQFKVSQPFIRKIFRIKTGKSYNEWVLDTKIQRAKELLRANPKLLVKDVAAQLGYEQLYFSTVFNKHVGMSPSEYKFRQQEEDNV